MSKHHGNYKESVKQLKEENKENTKPAVPNKTQLYVDLFKKLKSFEEDKQESPKPK